jgi:hypothetical protein
MIEPCARFKRADSAQRNTPMAPPLKIYLADLTYDTITLSTEVFPLNVGYVAAYALARFGDQVEVRLFKYIADLDQALNQEPPDILGLSNYCWNRRVGLEMFRILLQRKPKALTVWGGPNFPLELAPEQVTLLTDLIDTYGNTPAGRGQALKSIPESMLWRHSFVTQNLPYRGPACRPILTNSIYF